MKMTSINKIQFTSINDKRYYFSDGAVSLPFSHLTLSSLWDFKKPYPKIHTVIEKEKKRLLKLENQFAEEMKNERLKVLRSFYFTADNLLRIE